MAPNPSMEPMQVEEINYNHQTNNIPLREGSPEYMVASADGTESVSARSAKKRRREKHKRYTPDPITGIKQRKRKHKRKSLDVENPEGQGQPEIHRRITIKVLQDFMIQKYLLKWFIFWKLVVIWNEINSLLYWIIR